MIREIEQLIAEGMLDLFDRYFVRTLQRLDPSATPRILVLAALTRKAVGNGHVCLDLQRLVESPLPPGGGGSGRGGNSNETDSSELFLAELIAELQQSPLVGSGTNLAPLVFEEERLYLQRYWRYEEDLVREIRARAADPVSVREELLADALSRLFTGTDQDAQQRRGCSGIFRERLGLITGGPGTGKTTLVAKYLALVLLYAKAAEESAPRILLLAPTGKAAARLTESLQKKRGSIPCRPNCLLPCPSRQRPSTGLWAIGRRLRPPFAITAKIPCPAKSWWSMRHP